MRRQKANGEAKGGTLFIFRGGEEKRRKEVLEKRMRGCAL